jgi:orotidine-5'-phosphate decarboxylase
MNFVERLEAAEQRNKSLLCVGLDPIPTKFAPSLGGNEAAVFEFCRDIVDATQDLVLAFKPQIAHFAAANALDALQEIIAYIHQSTDVPVILDAKRGDIGSTAQMYADEAFSVYQADAVTVNPYLGTDSLEPFLAHKDKGVIVLCRTSNPGGEELQNLVLDSGERLYQRVASMAATQWNVDGNVMLVAGATNPTELADIRGLVGEMTLLIPGVGAQGGDIGALMRSAQGGGVVINSSRAVLYASSDEDYAQAARQVAMATKDEINRELFAIANDLRA